MDAFQAHYADIRDPDQQPRVAVKLRDQGLVTFGGITDRAALVAVARRLMTIRPHRDAGPDGVTVITGTGPKASGYAAFTDTELIPHTDGSSVPDPPGLLMLACLKAADEGGTTLLADGARIAGTGEGMLVSNTRWLHGRDRYTGSPILLRVLGDLLPSTGVLPGFPSPALKVRTTRAA